MLDSESLAKAISLAEEEATLAGRNVPIGAVVLNGQGEVVSKAHNESGEDQEGLGHAEILAIGNAMAKERGHKLTGFSLVVTLEPCLMCFGACLIAGIRDVYYMVQSPIHGAFTKYRINEALNVHFLPSKKEEDLLKAFFRGLRD